jgi:hypothetical protein
MHACPWQQWGIEAVRMYPLRLADVAALKKLLGFSAVALVARSLPSLHNGWCTGLVRNTNPNEYEAIDSYHWPRKVIAFNAKHENVRRRFRRDSLWVYLLIRGASLVHLTDPCKTGFAKRTCWDLSPRCLKHKMQMYEHQFLDTDDGGNNTLKPRETSSCC